MSKKSRRYNLDFNFIPEDILSYKNPHCLLYLVSADDIIDRFKYDSLLIFNNIFKGELNISDIYIQDNDCRCQLGLGKRPYVNTHKCNGCSMIRSILPGMKISPEKNITIQVGKYEGKNFQIVEYDDIFGKYTYNEEYSNVADFLLKKENKLCLLDDSIYSKNKTTSYYITPSYITNYIITSIFLNNKMHKYKIPNSILFEWAYCCDMKIRILKTTSFKFTDINKIESLNKNLKTPTAQTKISPLNEKVVIGILKQLTIILHFYSKYNFIHGKPSMESILITNSSCSYKYGKVIVDSPITLHLEPSNYTSFSFENNEGENIRLMSANVESINLIEYPVESIDINISTEPRSIPDNNVIPLIQNLRSHFVYYYKVGDKINELIKSYSYIGVPLLQSSFEFYCFIICILFEDSLYSTFMENETLRALWIGMWKSSEYEKLTSELLNLKIKDILEYEDIVSFVSKYYIRTDVVSYFYNCMSKI